MARKLYYLLCPILLLLFAIIISSCGGGDSTGVIPNLPQTNQPAFTPKHVSGYVYWMPSSETFIILETSGNDFIAQMGEYCTENYETLFSSQEQQNLYSQLKEEIESWQPLLNYNPSAEFYCVYQDNSISVNSEGFFDADILVSSDDDGAELEVVIEGERYAVISTVSTSDITGSNFSGNGTLKSCSKSIYTLPGGLSIFKIFSSPPMNLVDISLELEDSSIGVTSPPFFLKINGEVNYNLAYGVFKAGDLVSKAAQTKVSNGNGNNLYIPTDIIHETVSISGTVYTGGEPLIKGHVTSIGPKSSSFLDEDGNYVLPEVFKGSQRKVVATWWTGEQQGNNKTKYTEIRYVEYLDGDLTGFNFGEIVEPTPNPTVNPTMRPYNDPYYESQIQNVLIIYEDWENELGIEAATQKTVDWLNLNSPSEPSIPEGISKAYLDEYKNTTFWIEFEDGRAIFIENKAWSDEVKEVINQEQNKNIALESKNYNTETISPVFLNSSNATTINPEKILIIAPYAWQYEYEFDFSIKSIHSDIINELKKFSYYDNKVDTIVTNYPNDIVFRADLVTLPALEDPIVLCQTKDPFNPNIIDPTIIENLDDYGFIYIHSHCNPSSINIPIVDNHQSQSDWLTNHPNLYVTGYKKIKLKDYYISNDYPFEEARINTASINLSSYLQSLNLNFGDSIVYINGCNTYHDDTLKDEFINAGVDIYLGNTQPSYPDWSLPMGYYFFYYMMYGYEEYPRYIPKWLDPAPIESFPYPSDAPLSAQQSYNILTNYWNINPAPPWYTKDIIFGIPAGLKMFSSDPNREIYFPGRAEVTISEE